MEFSVGATPLVELDLGIEPAVYGKVEWFNAASADYGGGSVKTRIGKAMLDAAEAKGDLDDDPTLLEASSGNTGAAVARVGAERGYDVEIVMPDSAGRGKVEAVADAGAESSFVPRERGYDAFVTECRQRLRAHPDRYYHLDQYSNPANPAVHASTTGPEIWQSTDGEVTHFVAGAGTGGTVTGVSRALSDRGVAIHGYEPADIDHEIAGLKHMSAPEKFVPETFEPDALDGRHIVRTEVANEYVRLLRRRHADSPVPIRDTGQWSVDAIREHLRVDGEFIVGPSSGGCAALVERLTREGRIGPTDTVVIPLADRGDRYPERDLWADVL
ncbi:MAG: cysteine synthase [Natronomonas sp.]|jgi:cysteine synthase|uniref:PLP-dependent cysteine synthase family protein n=1 Tax=Natronomonas sp. TaxID=2184060 RepID=UPI003988CE70